MTTTFFLVRHAAHERGSDFLAGRLEGICLGEAGREQAARLGRRLRRERFDAIHASPRERTQETALAIASACGVAPVETAPELDEVDFGDWSGQDFRELERDPRWRRWNCERGTARTPGGESMHDVRRRIVGFMEERATTDRDRGLVLVSHAEVIRAALCHYLGLTADAWTRFDISPASISTLATGDWGARLLGLNEVAA